MIFTWKVKWYKMVLLSVPEKAGPENANKYGASENVL